MGRPVVSRKIYRTGEPIPESGVYKVSHSAHRLPDEVTLLHGQRFPRCEKCVDLVEFELVKNITNNAGFGVVLFSLPVIDDEEAAA